MTHATSVTTRALAVLGWALGVIPGVGSYAWAGPCVEVNAAIDAGLLRSADLDWVMTHAPRMSESVLNPLIQRATGAKSSPPEAFAAYVALGFSRQASALRHLQQSAAKTPYLELGRSLAMLALGDPVGTGTIASTLTGGSRSLRRQVANVLSHLRQKRPRTLLFAGLKDVDPRVRLRAAEVHIQYRSRTAHRVLMELIRQASLDPELRDRAGRALSRRGYRLPAAQGRQLSSGIRADIKMRRLLRQGRRRQMRTARGRLWSQDPAVRAVGLAQMVAYRIGGAPSDIRSLLARSHRRNGPALKAQSWMMLGLLGDKDAIDKLPKASGNEVRYALWVFRAFGRLSRAARHPSVSADPLTRVFEEWIVRPAPPPPGEANPSPAELLEALESASPPAALSLARRLVGPRLGPDRLVPLLGIVGRHGDHRDVAKLMSMGRLDSESVRSSALLAASEACQR